MTTTQPNPPNNQSLKLKTLLLSLNKSKEITLDKFMEKSLLKHGFKTQITTLTNSFLKFFSITSAQLDPILIAFHQSLRTPRPSSPSSQSAINLVDLTLFIYQAIDRKLIHPFFIFFHLANILETQCKCTTIDFLTTNSLSIEQEININVFLFKIAQPLQLSEFEAIVVFKALNINNNGNINMLDFVKVIDSYRNDYESAPRIVSDDMNMTMTNRNFGFIGRFCSLCIEKGVAEIKVFKLSLMKIKKEEEVNDVEVNDDSRISMERFEEVLRKRFKETGNGNGNVSEEDIAGIVEAFTVNDKGVISFKEYRALLSLCKYEVISSTNQLNFTSKSSNRAGGKSLPLKDNKAGLEKLYEDILQMMTKGAKAYQNQFPKQTEKEKEQKQKQSSLIEENNHLSRDKKSNKDASSSVKRPTSNSQTQREQDIPKEMLTNIITDGLDEWRLIELLEDIRIPNNHSYLTCFDLLNLLQIEFNDLTKEKQMSLINLIDENKDGYISITDLSIFLLHYFNHKSIKLGWRIVSETLIERRIPIEEFVNKFPNDIIEYQQFNQLFINEFSLEKILVAEMYENLLNVIIKKHQRNIIKVDLIDYVNKVSSSSSLDNKPKKSSSLSSSSSAVKNKKPTLISQSIDCSNNNKLIKEDLMKILSGFITIDHFFQYINFPKEISLYEYKEAFLKKYNINYIEGIKIFYKLKDLSTGMLPVEELKNYLKTLCDKTSIKFNMKTLINAIDQLGNYLLLSLESYPFTSSPISIIELSTHLKTFFPNLNHRLLMNIIQSIDYDYKGITTYKSLCDFIYKYSKRQYSSDLILKAIAAYLDTEQYPTDSFISQEILLNQEEVLTMNETSNLLSNRLKLNQSQQQFFIDIGMTVRELTTAIKSIRLNEYASAMAKGMKWEEGSCLSTAVGIGDINYDDIDKFLYITINLQVTILDIYNYLKGKIDQSTSTTPSPTKGNSSLLKKLFLYLKSNDLNQTGFINYSKLYHLLRWQNARFHLQYISIWIMLHFNGNLDDYLKYKNLSENRYLTKQEFDFYFKDEEMLHETSIVNDIFDYFQNKHDMFDIKSYLDYIRFISNDYCFKPINDDMKVTMIISEIKEIERKTSKPFYAFLNEIRVDNPFGKIKTATVKKALNETFKDIDLNEQGVVLLVNYFSNKSYLLFDAIKAVIFIKKYSRYDVDCKGIMERIKKEKNKIEDGDLGEMNKASLVDFYKVMNRDYDIKTYEVLLLFLSAFVMKENRYKQMYDLDMKIFFKKYGIEISQSKGKGKKKDKLLIDKIKEPTKDDSDKASEKIFDSTKKKAEDKTKLETELAQQKQKLKKKQESEALRVFHRFAYFIKIKSNDNLQEFFEEYDLNHNGHISRDELLNILSQFNQINDNDRMIILNYADQNNMDEISIQKFINIITSIKFDEEEYEALQQEIIKSKPKFQSKINLNLLQTNVLTNKPIIKHNKDPLPNTLFTLQKHLLKSYNKRDSIEEEMFNIASQQGDPSLISFDDFSEIIHGFFIEIDNDEEEINPEMMGKLIDYAFEGEKSNAKITKLKKNKQISYNDFIKNVVGFKLKPLTNAQNEKKDQATQNMIKKKMEAKFEKKNNDYTKLFKNHFQKDIDLNNPEDIQELKMILFRTFCFKYMEIQSILDKDLYLFKKFLTNLSNVVDKELDYEIKEEDYFKRPSGKRVMTIFNNERAALKKCDQLYRSIGEGMIFFDRDFGPLPLADDYNNNQGKSSIYYHMNPPGQLDANMIEWYHIHQISVEATFLERDFEQSEVVQGCLGDCWFISALAAIKTKEYLIRGEFNESILDDGIINDEECVMLSSGVYPPLFHYFRRKGIYCFRFFKNFQWIYVIIDDRLPCMNKYNSAQKPKVLYGKCVNTREFWVSLIEKAYAKLHGCYEAIVSGCVDDAIMDLTGQVSKRVSLNTLITNFNIENDTVWKMIQGYNRISLGRKLTKRKTMIEKQIQSVILSKNNSVLACSVESDTDHQEICINQEKSGLLVNHGYVIMYTFEIPKPNGKNRKTSRLLCLKNPWGFKVWNGKWGVHSGEFERNKTALNSLLSKVDLDMAIVGDSMFLMCFSDFRKIFTKIFMGLQLYPHCIGFYYEEMWSIDPPKGLPFSSNEHFCNNPQYYIEVRNPIVLFAEIMQNDPRMLASADGTFPFKDLIRKTCLVIMKAKGKQRLTEFKKEDVVTLTPVRLHKDNSLHFLLEPGEYMLMPCNCDTGEEGKFRLVLYVRDTFINEEKVNDNDFINKFNNFSIEKMINEKESEKPPKPRLIQENSISSIRDTKEEKMKVIYYQLNQALMAKN